MAWRGNHVAADQPVVHDYRCGLRRFFTHPQMNEADGYSFSPEGFGVGKTPPQVEAS
jgi:hypothetical protein